MFQAWVRTQDLCLSSVGGWEVILEQVPCCTAERNNRDPGSCPSSPLQGGKGHVVAILAALWNEGQDSPSSWVVSAQAGHVF